MAVNDNDDLVYETNEKGERVLVRSVSSEHRVYIRFINRVYRPVDVWWRDYQGKRRHYERIPPRNFLNMDTFVTHPWEFTDPATNENYVINNKKIFRAPSVLAGSQQRTNWLISVSVRSLRHIVMLALANRLGNASKVPALGLPRQLETDLENLITVIQTTPEPPART